MNRLLLRWGFGFIFTLLLLGQAAGYYAAGLFDSLDNLIYDARLHMAMPGTLDDHIVIVDIDEKSLAEIGRWPWGRDRMSGLIDQLSKRYGTTVVGFDVVMPEPDHSSGLAVLDRLAAGSLHGDTAYKRALDGLRPSLDYDASFAHALSGRSTVLGYYFSASSSPSGALPAPLSLNGVQADSLSDWPSYGGNLPAFQTAAGRAGFLNPVLDADGKVRRVALLARYHGQIYSSLSLATVRALLGDPPVTLDEGGAQRGGSVEAVELHTPNGTLRIPVDAHGAALVPYRGEQRSFRYVSAGDVLTGRADPTLLQGRIALVGTSAPGLVDLRSTPVGRAFPGVEIHANLIQGMLDERIPNAPGYIAAAQLVLLCVIGLTMVFAVPWQMPWRATLASLLLLATTVAGDVYLWGAMDWALPLASSLVLIASLFVWNMSLGYFTEYRTRRQFAHLFGQYVPPELVEEMSRQPTHYSMQGRRAELTVMFSDVRGFTTISEGLEPERLAQLMNTYLDAMTEIIRARRGTLDKFIGDAIMAFWGAPVADAEHARHAVITALGMQAELAVLNPKLAAQGLPALEIGIGLNTGPMTVGDMGSAVRRAYTVMGDSVNLASRLEGVTNYYGVGIVVGEATRRQTPEIAYRELDRIRVKGKHEPTAIYEPLGEAATLAPELRAEVEQWDAALACYRRRDWTEAARLVHERIAAQPADRLYGLYLARVEQLVKDPPGPEWDGVHVFDHK